MNFQNNRENVDIFFSEESNASFQAWENSKTPQAVRVSNFDYDINDQNRHSLDIPVSDNSNISSADTFNVGNLVLETREESPNSQTTPNENGTQLLLFLI